MRAPTNRLLAAALLLASTACVRNVPIAPEALPAVANIAEGEPLEVEHGGRVYTVSNEASPRVVVDRKSGCSITEQVFQADECKEVVLALGEFEVTDGTMSYVEASGPLFKRRYEQVRLSYEELPPLLLRFEDLERRPWFGIGLGLGGPARFLTFQLHVHPFEWFALDAGAAALAHVGGSMHAGARLRPVAFDTVRPFVGAYISRAVVGRGEIEEEDGSITHLNAIEDAWGPRVGIDIQADRHAVFTLEIIGVIREGDSVGWFSYSPTESWGLSTGASFAFLL